MKSIRVGTRRMSLLFAVIAVSSLMQCRRTAEAFVSPQTAANHRASVTYQSPISIEHTCFRAAFLASDAQQTEGEGASSENNRHESLRDTFRSVTGFSLTACRATWRAATGISLTTIYASTVAVTGLWIRKIMHAVLSVFPAWFRYFLQPFLILYYSPLFILRSLTRPNRRSQNRRKHERIVEGWKEAVQYAEATEKEGYWPVTVSEDGYFEAVLPPKPDETKRQNLANAVGDAVEQATSNSNGAQPLPINDDHTKNADESDSLRP